MAVPLGGVSYSRMAAGRGRKVFDGGRLKTMGKMATVRAEGLRQQVHRGLRMKVIVFRRW